MPPPASASPRPRSGPGAANRPPTRAGGRDSVAAARRPAPSRSSSYAAIDLGTNNCRLLIARAEAAELVIVDAFSRIVRLGEGLHGSGRISGAAMDRAVAALAICADKLRRRNVTLSRAVATEACRRASNGAELVDRVRRETGILLDVISSEEEARLAVMGCHTLLEPGDGPALIFDIGGGSTELMLVETGSDQAMQISDWVSVPWGVVSLSEHAPLQSDEPGARAASYNAMRRTTAEAFAAFAERVRHRVGADTRLLGTSGTVTTLASVYLDLPRYDRRAVDGLAVPATAMRDISQQLARASIAERATIGCIGRERADLVVAGCAILESIMDLWPTVRVGVADRGIREGILRSLAHCGGHIPITRRAVTR